MRQGCIISLVPPPPPPPPPLPRARWPAFPRLPKGRADNPCHLGATAKPRTLSKTLFSKNARARRPLRIAPLTETLGNALLPAGDRQLGASLAGRQEPHRAAGARTQPCPPPARTARTARTSCTSAPPPHRAARTRSRPPPRRRKLQQAARCPRQQFRQCEWPQIAPRNSAGCALRRLRLLWWHVFLRQVSVDKCADTCVCVYFVCAVGCVCVVCVCGPSGLACGGRPRPEHR